VKAHDDNHRNELADHLAKEAACSIELDTAYIKIPKSAVTSELKEKGVQVWQQEWDASTKGELKKYSSILQKAEDLKGCYCA
jgi:hypothetical protein